jgi:oligopeptidase B
VFVGAVPGETRGEGAMAPPFEVDDDLHWLRDDSRTDPAVLRHLELENIFSTAALSGASALREEVLAELKARMVEADASVPYPRGPYEYFTRHEKGRAYVVHCRRLCGGGAEEVVCDVNALAAGKEMCDVTHVSVSPDHATAAVGVDFTGGETYTVSFTALGSGGHAARDELRDTAGGFCWGGGADCLYLTLDAAHRPHRCYRHVLGRPQAEDELLFEELDERFWLSLHRSRSGAFAVLESSSKLSAEVHVLPLKGARAALRCLAPRRDLVLYSVEHFSAAPDGSGGAWVVVSNDRGAVNFRVSVAPLDGAGGAGGWVEVLPHSEAACIEGVDAFAGGLLLCGRAGGAAQLWVSELPRADGGAPLRPVRLPPRESVGTMGAAGGNAEHAGVHPRFTFSSPRCPPCTCEVDLAAALAGAGPDAEGDAWGVPGARLAPAAALSILKQRAAPNTDLGAYATARVWATAGDGARIPISLVWRPSAVAVSGRGAPPPQPPPPPPPPAPPLDAWLLPAPPAGGASPPHPPPCLLYAYGAYGVSVDLRFSSATLSLCDRGVVYAVAHIRGGGEMGRAWYEGVGGRGGGRLLTKKNTFSDYFVCAEALLEKGWARRGRLAAMGASAGGLLMGVALNTRPDLFCAVLSCVGFVDIILSVADPSIPLAVTEWEEWGNPNTAEFFAYIKSYSPVNNVAPQKYPPALLTGGLHDSRVPFWEPAKFAQRLRAATTGKPGDILVKMDMGAGHFSFTDRCTFRREPPPTPPTKHTLTPTKPPPQQTRRCGRRRVSGLSFCRTCCNEK